MKMRLGDKAVRILTFLLGLSDGAIAAILEGHGMTAADADEGWTLLRGLGRRRLSTTNSSKEESLRDQLDEWENYWYPIIDAVLKRHFPQVHAHVFLNLQQSDRSRVVFSVDTLLSRLDGLADSSGPLGEDGPKALAFLKKRKVDESVLAPARELLAQVGEFAPDQSALTAEEEEAQLEEAERLAWGWYLEWSRISRVAIKSRRRLRKLGFLDSRGKPTTLPDEVEVDDDNFDTDDDSDANDDSDEALADAIANAFPSGKTPTGEPIPVGHRGASPFTE